ncbi:SMI1/KNR4 family protein [Sutcliffiella halmapala]|uniref:SMI1/KNR4 family protein n=1 Tax=Sutcliffiella halmapala TaxID=79882 RepID=UPI0009951464|nr:SMI1/KNR4 family protein [Sutcliffiella halmapala]
MRAEWGMNELIGKVLDYKGPYTNYAKCGLTLIYLSHELKEDNRMIFPDNLAHSFFSSATTESIMKIENKYSMEFPKLYKNLIKECNGFSLEAGNLNFYGIDFGLLDELSQNEKAFFEVDVIQINKLSVPKNITSRYFIIGEDFYKNCWIGIKNDKTYYINRDGKELKETDMVNDYLLSVEKFNRHAMDIISNLKQLYKY